MRASNETSVAKDGNSSVNLMGSKSDEKLLNVNTVSASSTLRI